MTSEVRWGHEYITIAKQKRQIVRYCILGIVSPCLQENEFGSGTPRTIIIEAGLGLCHKAVKKVQG